MIQSIFSFLNQFIPKRRQVLLIGTPSPILEANDIAFANYMVANYNFKVYYAIEKQTLPHATKILNKKVKTIAYKSAFHIFLLVRCKFIFATYGSIFNKFSSKQVFVNVWHGVGHKKIGKQIFSDSFFIDANWTVATSPMTQKMFSEAFGVPINSVLDCGYPRNDLMLQALNETDRIKEKLEIGNEFSKVFIWLPTYRADHVGHSQTDGKEVDNPFQIENFDVERFQEILKKNNAICLIKPHPKSKQNSYRVMENIKMVSDVMIQELGLTLYHILAISNLLITDFSSVMIDFLLLDRKIICFSSDFELYKQSRGFYFKNVEEFIPSSIVQDQNSFFEYLDKLAKDDVDPDRELRQKVCRLYFNHQDDNSCKRLGEQVFKTVIGA